MREFILFRQDRGLQDPPPGIDQFACPRATKDEWTKDECLSRTVLRDAVGRQPLGRAAQGVRMSAVSFSEVGCTSWLIGWLRCHI